MKIELYPRTQLEALWEEDQVWFSGKAGQMPVCMRCGRDLEKELLMNSLSRHASIYICNICGMDEAMRGAVDVVLPFEKWHAVINGRLKKASKRKNIVPLSFCSLADIPGGLSAELACFRSSYKEHGWKNVKEYQQRELATEELVQEMQLFHQALFRMPEFRSLSALRRMCMPAEWAESPDTYYMRSETRGLYVWMQLNVQEGNNHLHVHYFMK